MVATPAVGAGVSGGGGHLDHAVAVAVGLDDRHQLHGAVDAPRSFRMRTLCRTAARSTTISARCGTGSGLSSIIPNLRGRRAPAAGSGPRPGSPSAVRRQRSLGRGGSCSHEPTDAASYGSSPAASNAPTSPASTSPAPAVASHGSPGGGDPDPPVGTRDERVVPLQQDHAVETGRCGRARAPAARPRPPSARSPSIAASSPACGVSPQPRAPSGHVPQGVGVDDHRHVVGAEPRRASCRHRAPPPGPHAQAWTRPSPTTSGWRCARCPRSPPARRSGPSRPARSSRRTRRAARRPGRSPIRRARRPRRGCTCARRRRAAAAGRVRRRAGAPRPGRAPGRRGRGGDEVDGAATARAGRVDEVGGACGRRSDRQVAGRASRRGRRRRRRRRTARRHARRTSTKRWSAATASADQGDRRCRRCRPPARRAPGGGCRGPGSPRPPAARGHEPRVVHAVGERGGAPPPPRPAPRAVRRPTARRRGCPGADQQEHAPAP